MRVERENEWFPVVIAPEVPSVSEIRRVVRLFHRGGMEAEFTRCTADEHGYAERAAKDGDEGPFAWTLDLDGGEWMRIVGDPHPYAIVDFEQMYRACEAVGLNVCVNGQGDWQAREYEVEVFSPHDRRDRFPIVTGRGPSLVAAMFAAAWGAERMTRVHRWSCGRGGFSRPWVRRSGRDER